jgi:hypothetical protein
VRFSRVRLRQPSVELGIIAPATAAALALFGPEAAGTASPRASINSVAISMSSRRHGDLGIDQQRRHLDEFAS